MMFSVGQPIVYVDDSGRRFALFREILPRKGAIYTVRWTDGETVRLEEIINRPRLYIDGYSELSFWASRFRPLIRRQTDISFAHEILRKASEPANIPEPV